MAAQMTGWSQPWRRTAASAFVMGVIGIALTGCASGDQKAEDQAVAEMTGRLTTLQDSAKYSLRTSPDRGRAREYFASQQGGYVYASSIDGNAISWSIALVGQGGRSSSGSSTVIRLRSCLTMQSAAALELKLTTVTCPTRFTNSSNFDSTDRDIDLLALGKHDSGAIRPTSPDADMPPNNEAYRQRLTLPDGAQETAETHRKRVTAALQKAVNEGPLDRTGVARVLAPLGYDDTSVQVEGRSDGPGGLGFGVSTGAGCVYGGIRGRVIRLEAGGIIADGGCLPARGH